MMREFYFFFANPIKRVYRIVVRPRTFGVKTMIMKDGKFLLVRVGYGKRTWSFPGGMIDRGESREDAARREVFEEIGVELDSVTYLGEHLFLNEGKRDTVYYFTAKSDAEDLIIDDQEIVDAGWFGRDEFPQPLSGTVDRMLRLYDTRRNHMEKTRTIFFSGIGGIGMSALAQLLAERGDRIIGSDRTDGPVAEMLRRKGIEVAIGHDGAHVPEEADLLVYSAAVPEDNPERVRARELGIPEVAYFTALGEVSREYRTVAVAGTHGKTTTTGMLTKILRDADASPTAVVGSIVQDFGSNYLSGTSDLFVVEACEFQRHFLEISPEILVITNLEFDHSDYYQDLADVQDAFRSFIKKLPTNGIVITDAEHPHIAPLLEGITQQVVDYTKEPEYPLTVPGAFNQQNAKAAAAAAKAVLPSLTNVTINPSLEGFRGTWRRFEYKGTHNGAQVYDDYAHHPTAIKETLKALKEKAQGRVFVAFHPHTYSRTRDLLDGFARAFSDADEVLIAPIFAAREINDGSVSSELLAERIRDEGVSARALSMEEIEDVLRVEPKEGDVIMTMGAGDIYKVASALVS